MGDNPNGINSIDTIGDLIDDGYELSVHCNNHGCHNNGRVDLEALADRLGRDHPRLAHDLKPYFKCSKCGSKDIGFILSPTGPGMGYVVSPDHPRYRK